MIKKVLIVLLGFAVLSACNSDSGSGDLSVPDSIAKGTLKVSDKAMESIVDNISSPIEIAALIINIGVPYSKRYLAPTDYLGNYNTSVQQAFALGIFTADLGYLNMYNKTGTVIDYLSTIKSLSDAINCGQFFDFQTLKRLATNNSNLDSLKYISMHSFNQMDKYLRENNRGNLSALVIAGAWLEGIYLATQVHKEKNNAKLAERIGEQKIILADLMLILKNYSNDPSFKKYYDEFVVIKNFYNEVKITYEAGEPETVEVDGMLTIVQKDISVVSITDEQLASITKTIEEIRIKLIKI